MKQPTRLWNRDFFLLWQGQLVSQIGSKAFVVGMMFWVQQTTGSASLVGALMTMATLPAVLIGPLAGAMADRYSRRAIIVVADLISGLSSLTVASLFFLRPEATSLLITVLFAVAVLNSLARACFRPSVSAAIPDLVPQPKITAANSWRQGASRISAVLGQGSGGMIYGWYGAPVLFLADGLSYIFSAISECFIRIPPHQHQKADSDGSAFRRVWEDSFEGLHYVWKRPGMRGLLLIEGLANLFLMPLLVLLPFFVERNLQGGAAWYGWLLAGMSAGGIIGFALAGILRLEGRLKALGVLAACLGGELLFGLLSFVNTPVLALVVLTLLGVLIGLFNVQALTIFQTTASSGFRGRVMGLLGTISMGAAPIGMLMSGIIGDLTGQNVSLIFLVCSILAMLSTLLLGARTVVLEYLATGPEEFASTWDTIAAPTGPIQKGLGTDL